MAEIQIYKNITDEINIFTAYKIKPVGWNT